MQVENTRKPCKIIRLLMTPQTNVGEPYEALPIITQNIKFYKSKSNTFHPQCCEGVASTKFLKKRNVFKIDAKSWRG